MLDAMPDSPAPDSPAPDGVPETTSGPAASELPSGAASEAVAKLRPLQLLTVVIGAGTLMCAGARILIEPQVRTPSLLAVGVVLVALLGAAWAIRAYGYNVPSLPLGLPRTNAFETSLRYFASTTVLRASLAEAPFFVALFLSVFEPRSWLLLVVALPGVLTLFWLHAWPSARTAVAVEAGLEREGAESYLHETLGLHRAS